MALPIVGLCHATPSNSQALSPLPATEETRLDTGLVAVKSRRDPALGISAHDEVDDGPGRATLAMLTATRGDDEVLPTSERGTCDSNTSQ